MMKLASLSLSVLATSMVVLQGCEGSSTSTSSKADAGPDAATPAADSGADAQAPGDSGVDAPSDAPADTATCPYAEGDVIDAVLKTTCDDEYKLYVNGVLVDDTPRIWSSPQTYNIKLFRHPAKKNVIAFEAINTQAIDGFDRGLVADLSYTVGGASKSVVSDATWKLGTTLGAGWYEVGFAEAGWVAATEEGAHGIAPWGAVLGTSNAKWLWSYASNVPAASKAGAETVYLRKTIYVDLAGNPSATPSACP